MKKVCVLLPAYNEAHNIATLIKKIHAVKIDNVVLTPLVVNDGSRDQTADIARQAGVTVLSHTFNRGVGAAIIVSDFFNLSY